MDAKVSSLLPMAHSQDGSREPSAQWTCTLPHHPHALVIPAAAAADAGGQQQNNPSDQFLTTDPQSAISAQSVDSAQHLQTQPALHMAPHKQSQPLPPDQMSLTILSKPQRPPPRAVRIHDENMPLHIANGPIGKTLHQRTKSASNINIKKQVLGEATANAKIAPKDDSEVGKASPGKIRLVQEPVMPPPAGTFSRPAVRPLAPKSANMQIAAAAAATTKAAQSAAYQEPVQKKVVPKKSTKVLKDPVLSQPQPEVPRNTNAIVPTQTNAAQGTSYAPPPKATVQETYNVQHQTQLVPLRDEPAARPQPVATAVQPAVPSQQQSYLQPQPDQALLPQAVAPASCSGYAVSTPTTDHYDAPDDYDEDDYVTARSFGFPDTTMDLTTVFNPQHTKKANLEIAEAKAFVEQTRTAEDIEDEQWDTSMVAEYGDEIFEYMREMESRMSPNPFYMELQHEIQWSMRGVLMDWVVQVHQRFNLLPETLFLTINYIDRFLSCKIVSLGKLQLVGATAIFVAAKYEEVNCPTISEIIYMVDNGYSADELLKAERFMLSMLQFELGWPGPMSFLRRISKADDYDLETRTLAKYFLEVTIMDERFVGCKPSFLAAGAHCMARLMLRKGDWTQAHVYYSNYTFRQMHRLLDAIYKCCEDPEKHHGAVYEKYTDKRYKRASTFVRGEMAKGFKLPFTTQSNSLSLGAQNPTTTSWLPQQQ